MEAIVLVWLLSGGFGIVLGKYNFYEWFENYSQDKAKFIYKMSKCSFCLAHHVSVIATIVVGLLTGFELYYLILPICSATIQNYLND